MSYGKTFEWEVREDNIHESLQKLFTKQIHQWQHSYLWTYTHCKSCQ